MKKECKNCPYNWLGKCEEVKGAVGLYTFRCSARKYVGLLCPFESKRFEERIRELGKLNRLLKANEIKVEFVTPEKLAIPKIRKREAPNE